MTDTSNPIDQWEFCFLPSSLLEYPPKSKSCPSAYSLLISLLLYNAFSAAFNLCLGHDWTRHAIQDIIPNWLTWLKSSSRHWQPYAAIFMTLLQIIGMVVATAIARSNGFTASFGALLGLWSMRPRMALLTFIYDAWGRCDPLWRYVFRSEYHGRGEGVDYAFSKPGPFRYTLRDTILSECLLNIFSIYFALDLLQKVGQDGFGCQGKHDGGRPECVGALQSALGWKIIGGCLSAFVLAGQFIECLGTRYRKRQREENGERRNRRRRDEVDDEERLGKLVFFTSLFIAFVNFITSWEIWGVFVNAAGTTYCPGSVVGTGVTWGVVLAVNSCMRPLLGGGTVS